MPAVVARGGGGIYHLQAAKHISNMCYLKKKIVKTAAKS